MDKANGLLRLFAWQPARVAASLKLPLSLHIGRETGGEAHPGWPANTVIGIGGQAIEERSGGSHHRSLGVQSTTSVSGLRR